MHSVASLTPLDFKTFFPSAFDYLPVWQSEQTYNMGALVFYDTLFYTCLTNGTTTPPTDTDKWVLQNPQSKQRDFVTDADIVRAFLEAQAVFKNFWSKTELTNQAYFYLTAHFLYMDRQGQSGAGAISLVTGQRVGNVSIDSAIPDWALRNPIYSNFWNSYYGQKYTLLINPYMTGAFACFAVFGRTNP